MLFELIVVGAVALAGYIPTRRFVREKLRYIDGIAHPAVPFVVGAAVAVAAAPVVWLLPWVGAGTAMALGAGAGAGAWQGARDVKRLPGM